MCQKNNVKFGDVTILSGNAMQDLPWRKRASSRLFFFSWKFDKINFFYQIRRLAEKMGAFCLNSEG